MRLTRFEPGVLNEVPHSRLLDLATDIPPSSQ